MIVLHTDTRDGYKTWSTEKFYDMANNQCHNQMNYFNLFLTGVIENCGTIVGTKEQLFEYVRELYLDYKKTHHFSGIYLITNRVNNKQYIGQSVDVLERLDQHRFASKCAIDKAIQQYGIENFTFDVLEQCEEKILNEREKYWCDTIYECSTYIPNGYNVEPAGTNSHGARGIVISAYSLNGKKICTYPSIMAASRAHNCNSESIREVLNNPKRLSQGQLWCTGTKENCPPYQKPKSAVAKPTDVYTKTGEFLGTYQSLTEAVQIHNANLSSASASYNTPGFTANNLFFVPTGTKPILANVKIRNVYCYDKQTRNFIAQYDNLTVAAKSVKGDRTAISRAAKGQQYYSYGYIWSFIKFEQIPADFRNINSDYTQTKL